MRGTLCAYPEPPPPATVCIRTPAPPLSELYKSRPKFPPSCIRNSTAFFLSLWLATHFHRHYPRYSIKPLSLLPTTALCVSISLLTSLVAPSTMAVTNLPKDWVQVPSVLSTVPSTTKLVLGIVPKPWKLRSKSCPKPSQLSIRSALFIAPCPTTLMSSPYIATSRMKTTSTSFSTTTPATYANSSTMVDSGGTLRTLGRFSYKFSTRWRLAMLEASTIVISSLRTSCVTRKAPRSSSPISV